MGGTGFFDEGTTGISEVDDPSFFTHKKAHLVVVFEFVDLLAEGRLPNAQGYEPVAEVQSFAENNDHL